jgi:hypothetical protein
MIFFKFFEFKTNFEKTGGLPKPYPGGFGKPTGLPPVFTGFVNRATILLSICHLYLLTLPVAACPPCVQKQMDQTSQAALLSSSSVGADLVGDEHTTGTCTYSLHPVRN